MRIRPFEYRAVTSLSEALAELDRGDPGAALLAGGTDLVLAMKLKTALPRRVIGLHRVHELAFVREDGASVRVGALTTHADVAADPVLKGTFPSLCEASGLIGSWQIRGVGTIGGNLCTASPAADTAPPLLALGARMVVADAGGEREIPATSFFTGPRTNALGPNELLKEIVIDRPRGRAAGCYRKLRRRKAVDVSLLGVAFQAELDPGGKRLARVAVALGAVAPTPIRVPVAEELLTGLSPADAREGVGEFARTVAAAARPIGDVRASGEYRRAILEVYARRCAEWTLRALAEGGGG